MPLAEFKRQFSHVTLPNSKLALDLQLTTRQTTSFFFVVAIYDGSVSLASSFQPVQKQGNA